MPPTRNLLVISTELLEALAEISQPDSPPTFTQSLETDLPLHRYKIDATHTEDIIVEFSNVLAARRRELIEAHHIWDKLLEIYPPTGSNHKANLHIAGMIEAYKPLWEFLKKLEFFLQMIQADFAQKKGEVKDGIEDVDDEIIDQVTSKL